MLALTRLGTTSSRWQATAGRIVVEIKRSGHDATLEDLQQLDLYLSNFARGADRIEGAFITSDSYAVRQEALAGYGNRPDFHLLTRAKVHQRAKRHYEEYRSILDGDLAAGSAGRRAEEVVRTRHVLEYGPFRGREARARGIYPAQPSRLPLAWARAVRTRRRYSRSARRRRG